MVVVAIKARTKVFLVSFLIVLSVALARINFEQHKHDSFKFDGSSLIMNCIREIVKYEKMRNLLIVGRPEHYFKLNVPAIANMTTIKIYKRLEGWKYLRIMLQYKWMSCLVLFNRFREIEEYFQQFRRFQSFNSRMHFIFVPLYSPNDNDLEKIGQHFIKYKIINYIILLKEKNLESIQITTNFPYQNEMCGNYSAGNDEMIARFHGESGFEFFRETINLHDFYTPDYHTKMYPPKIPRNLHKCELHIVTGLWPPNVIDVYRDYYPGIEIEFIRMISEYMNFAPKYLYLNEMVGGMLANSSWTGFMGYLQRNEADIAIGAVHVDPDRVFVFDISDWYIYNYMLWIVPKMKPLPRSAILEHFVVNTTIMAKAVFISICIATIIAILIAARLVKAKDTINYGQFGYVTLTLFQMFMAQSLGRPPRTVQVRRVFALWLGFCTFLIFFVQTSITSYFLSPGRAHQLHDIQQAFDLNLRITYDAFYDAFVQNASLTFEVPKRNEKFAVIPSLNLVSRGLAVTFIDRLRAIYITKQWLREDGSIPIHLLQNNPVHRYWVQVVMTKGHFLSPWINDLVRRAWNNGFWLFEENRYIERRTIQCSVRRQIILNNDIQGLNNKDAVIRYNDAIYEAFPKGAANQQVNEIFAPTAATEKELLEIFRVSTSNSITFDNLRALFELYLIGLLLGIVSFLCEIGCPRIAKKMSNKKLKGKREKS